MPIPKKKPFLNKEVNENKFSDFESDMLDIDDLDLENIDLEDDEDIIDLPKSTTNYNENRDKAENEKIHSTANEAMDEPENKPVQKPTSEDKSTPISYSSRAFKDGYRFDSLSLEEQRMTRYLYTSEDSLSSFYLVAQKTAEMNAYPDERFHFKYGFGMPYNGWYYGCIIGCKRSKNKLNSYTLKILVSDTDVRCFSFTPGLLDPISRAITRDLGIKNNVFSRDGYSDLRGHIVMFEVKNVETQSGNVFSNITDFDFLTNKETSIIEKMINIMINQS